MPRYRTSVPGASFPKSMRPLVTRGTCVGVCVARRSNAAGWTSRAVRAHVGEVAIIDQALEVPFHAKVLRGQSAACAGHGLLKELVDDSQWRRYGVHAAWHLVEGVLLLANHEETGPVGARRWLCVGRVSGGSVSTMYKLV